MDHFGAEETLAADLAIDQLISEYDDSVTALPDIESQPHLLISKVRQHYMRYMIKLITVNYETNQKLLNKNIYLPSAIWRCAKSIEMSAAYACMTVSLYRKKIVAEIKELKEDTYKGKLNKKLFSFLKIPPQNEKKTQTYMSNLQECNCQCMCGLRKKRRMVAISPSAVQNEQCSDIVNNETMSTENMSCKPLRQCPSEAAVTQPVIRILPKPIVNTPVEVTHDADEIMMQLEKLFQGDPDDDNIFEGTLCDLDYSIFGENIKKSQNAAIESPKRHDIVQQPREQDLVIESHSEQIKLLDERLDSLAGLLVNKDVTATQVALQPEKTIKKHTASKWLSEEYFLKSRLFALLDQISDVNRKKLARIKEMLVDLFGPDSDDEGVVSPLEETSDFVLSCKERIAPWVVKLLTPYYVKGRIKGKALFKALVKHLIRLIYQCSRYPQEYEVNSFVADFLQNHRMIRCEADFKQFKIDNI